MSQENTTVLSSFYVSLGQKHFPIVFYLNTFPKKNFFSYCVFPKHTSKSLSGLVYSSIKES